MITHRSAGACGAAIDTPARRCRLVRSVLLLLGAGFVSAMAGCRPGADRQPPAAAPDPFCIVAFGDSTTARRATVGHVYADQLTERLAAAGWTGRVVNAGGPGNTTLDAWRRLEADVLARRPGLVIVQFGINDSVVKSSHGKTQSRVSVPIYTQHLQRIVATLQSAGAKVILMTPNPLLARDVAAGERWERNIQLRHYAEAVREIARAEGVPLVDVYQAYLDHDAAPDRSADELLEADGIHPTDLGHALVTELLWEPVCTAIGIASSSP